MNARAPVLATWIVACAAVPASFAADPNAGRDLAASCAACHGTNGRSLGGIESLAGVDRNTLLAKLRDFRSGAKPATVMQQITKGYSEQQLELIAAYFAAQK